MISRSYTSQLFLLDDLCPMSIKKQGVQKSEADELSTKVNKKQSFLRVISLCADVLHGLQPPTQVARICLLLSYFSVQF